MNKSEYRRIHRLLSEGFRKADRCEFCETKTAKKYEWALRKGHEYTTEVKDYIELCASCHRRYDYTDERRRKQGEKFMEEVRTGKRTLKTALGKFGANNPSSKPVIQIDRNTGEEIAEYVSTTAAAEAVGILLSSISQCLHGKIRTAGKFKWKYKQKQI